MLDKDCKLYRDGDKVCCSKDDKPYPAGLVRFEDHLYFIGRDGFSLTGKVFLHTSDTNGLVERGIYKFKDDGTMDKNYYKMPKDMKKHHSHHKHNGKSNSKVTKESKKVVIIAASALFVAALVPIIAVTLRNRSDNGGKNKGDSKQDIVINYDKYDDSLVYLTSPSVAEYYKGTYSAMEIGLTEPHQPFIFNYSVSLSSKVGFRKDDVKITFRLSENESLEKSNEYTLNPNEISVYIDNLKVSSHYYYDVKFTYPEGEEYYKGSFITADTERFLEVDGIDNVHDFGGHKTIDNKVIKQNLLICGSELDGLSYSRYAITTKGVEYMNKTFGFVSEMDLRNSSIYAYDYKSKLGVYVIHDFYNAPKFGEIFYEDAKESLNKIFTNLSNKGNYPIYMHCTDGCEYTSTVNYLLGAVLGMSNQSKLQQFESNIFSTAGLKTANLNPILYGFDVQDNTDSAETNNKVVNWLKDEIGITQDQIDSIRNIFLG